VSDDRIVALGCGLVTLGLAYRVGCTANGAGGAEYELFCTVVGMR
jgi:hypothetical protein